MAYKYERLKPATDLPPALAERVLRHWERYEQACADAQVPPLIHPELRRVALRVWGGSEFVAQSCLAHPEMLADLTSSGDLFRPYQPREYTAVLGGRLADAETEADLARLLRQFRRREMVRLAWRDLAGWSGLRETLAALTDLAQACIDRALDRLYGWEVDAWGTPVNAQGEAQPMVVLGMGKLGAGELNFSSDIDLIFAYPEEGETQGGGGTSNEEFFLRLGRRLIGVLDSQTADGQVFRVDMRLRPHGDSGPLAMSFEAMEHYYQAYGRDWERYAMVKARPVAGDPHAGDQLMALLRPFVYRRYLDFGAFDALRQMKELIRQQVRRSGMETNIKLGPGGIREVEFVAQVFQLIRGGREPQLQERSLLAVIELLAEAGYLPGYVARQLGDAYCFLRQVENRLQAVADEQTHSLPQDDQGQSRLAFTMGFRDWASFKQTLDRYRTQVHEHFEQVFAAPQTESRAGAATTALDRLWQDLRDREQVQAVLADAGFDDAGIVRERLASLRDSSLYRNMSTAGKERLDQLIPMLLGAARRAAAPSLALLRSLQVIESIGRRSAYLALLAENPMALSQMVKLCAASPWISTYVSRHPLLLDELLDPRSLYAPLQRNALEGELASQLAQVPDWDLERQMDTLRHFKQANVLRIAAVDVSQAMPLMVVSDHLTDIAEVVLDQVLRLAWRHLVQRHGRPRCSQKGGYRYPGFGVVGYGKLGGIELGYGSDLDLVFLHDGDADDGTTDGAKPLDNAVFFARLGQRIIHLLSATTPAGILYEVDVRLRPSGASGLLVSSIAGFADYQRQEAWTWEHQALSRTRLVAGDPQIAAQFQGIREEILTRQRDPDQLRREVREMRERMRRELSKSKGGQFDLKQDPGGIADIEFMVQYGVLRWACQHRELVRWTDVIRTLDGLAKVGVMDPSEAATLADAYRSYRSEVHRLTLQDQQAFVDESLFAERRAQVLSVWRRLMEE